MTWYYIIAVVAIVAQAAFVIQMHTNHRYALAKYKRERKYRPRTALIVPCRGLDTEFEKNIASFYAQDFENYELWFVVGEESDPAYDKLLNMRKGLAAGSKASKVEVVAAGHSETCGQKNHNLLHCYGLLGKDVEAMAFADSDVCVAKDWLSHLVYPLHQEKVGASGGYRWYVPTRNNAATLALSALNAKVAQLMGNMRFNRLWGGSMAIKVEVFNRVHGDGVWQRTISDDLPLTCAVKGAGLKVAYVPACLAASHEETTWARLFEFGRRQFLITKVCSPGTWWFGVFGCVFSIAGLWGGAAMAGYGTAVGARYLELLYAVPITFFAGQMIRVAIRQHTARELLKESREKMQAAMLADIIFSWAWTIIMAIFVASSAFGKTMRWRGIRYRLVGPTDIVVLGPE
jgi:cellulose synthase/poly-beta-1,6-N-acetylglucosamine synthase-like glycosyltransferase